MSVDELHDTQVFLEMIQDFDVAMLTTRRNGHLRSRPMVTSKNQFDLNLWFLATDDPGLIDEIARDPSVNVAYSDHGRNRFVSVCGRATVVLDPNIRRSFWVPNASKWLDGHRNADTLLVKVVVSGVEYWDTPGSTMISMFTDLDLPFTGEVADLSESKELQLTSQQYRSAEQASRGLGANRNE